MGRPRKDGTRIDNTMRRRGILMDYLRQEANGQHNWFAFSANGYALDRGECRVTIANDMRKLAEDGKVELDFQNGSRFFVRIPEPKEAPVETIPLRVCAKCGTEAPDPNARFCWKCGASLLTEKELLKEAYDRVLPKIAKLGTDSTEMNEIMTIIGKVANMAFKEVVA